MYNPPLISNHLYVAALASQDRGRSSRMPHQTNNHNPTAPGRAIPLEVMAHAHAMPATTALESRHSPARAFSLSPSEGERAGERGPLAPDSFSLSPSDGERAGERGPLAPDSFSLS